MGLRLFGSSSTYDEQETVTNPPVVGNPDPRNFKIRHYLEMPPWLILFVNYPQCRNYEGNKILVYQGATLDEIRKQGSIDPHFSDCRWKYSPFARFEPTKAGWKAAMAFVEMMRKENICTASRHSQSPPFC